MADSKLTGPPLVGQAASLTFWHPCIALDPVVQFKWKSGKHAWTQIWVQIQPGSSGPYCTKWVNDQQGLSLDSCLTFPSPNPHFKPTFESLTVCQVLSDRRQRQISLREGCFAPPPRQRIQRSIKQVLQFHFTVNKMVIGFVSVYGISTIVGYLMPNPVYTYISDMHDL